jgi:hypothetical protein
VVAWALVYLPLLRSFRSQTASQRVQLGARASERFAALALAIGHTHTMGGRLSLTSLFKL